MTREHIEADLVAYHFAEVGEDARERIERHLVECARCVRAFVEIKRAVETGEDAPAPSRTARARLRRAVAVELGLETKWSWWERPLAVALAASVVLLAGGATRAIASTPGAPPHALSVKQSHPPAPTGILHGG